MSKQWATIRTATTRISSWRKSSKSGDDTVDAQNRKRKISAAASSSSGKTMSTDVLQSNSNVVFAMEDIENTNNKQPQWRK